MLHGARPQERLPALSRQQEELARAQQEQVRAPASWQRLGLAQENFSRAPQVERSLALESLGPEQAPRVLLRRRSREAWQGEPLRQLQVRGAAESREEEAEEQPQRASCEPLWRLHLSRLYPRLLFVRPLPLLR